MSKYVSKCAPHLVLAIALAVSQSAYGQVQSLWDPSVVPPNSSVGSPAELGMKFQVAEPGQIQGVRFYKGAGNTGTHIGNLWDDAGNLLATVAFTNETGSGWQTAYFSQPVFIQPGTTYVASYYSPNGGYSYARNMMSASFSNGAILVPSSSQSGGNGIYTYSSISSFPTQSYQASCYFVDILFVAQPDQSAWNAQGTPAGSGVGSPGERGVKFQVSQTGQVQGIRFYKASTNTGLHSGHLWDSSGNLLASVTFTNETASGWQTAYFSPVTVKPNTTYVASYYSPNGGYSATFNYFTNSYTSGYITFPSDASSGGNGVYIYSSSPAFPTNPNQAINYWVDILFAPQSGGLTASQPAKEYIYFGGKVLAVENAH